MVYIPSEPPPPPPPAVIGARMAMSRGLQLVELGIGGLRGGEGGGKSRLNRGERGDGKA